MPTKTDMRRNGASRPPVRRWLLSAPVPLPQLGDYGQFIAVYDLDRVMQFDWLGLPADLRQQDRDLKQQMADAAADFAAQWPTEKQQADPDAFDTASRTFNAQIAQPLRQQRDAVGRDTALYVLRDVLVRIVGPDNEEVVADPTDPAAWEGWSNYILNWLTTTGIEQAREMLVGKK